MKFFLILLLNCLLVCSCKTSKQIRYENFTKLEIAQITTKDQYDKIEQKANSTSIILVAKDTSIFIPASKTFISQKSIKPVSQLSEAKFFKQRIIDFNQPETKKSKSRNSQIIFSVILFAASILAVLFSPFMGFGIIGAVVAAMLFILAIKDFAPREEPIYDKSEDSQPKYPYNKYARLAWISFLISVILTSTIFWTLTGLLILGIIGFFVSLVFGISALIDIKKNKNKERGKQAALTVVILSSLPLLFILTIFVLVSIYGIGE